jgi:hypothetical protein
MVTVSSECGRPKTTRLDAATRPSRPEWLEAHFVRMAQSGERSRSKWQRIVGPGPTIGGPDKSDRPEKDIIFVSF